MVESLDWAEALIALGRTELDAATALAEQMQWLRRLARQVLWVNPHAGRAGYAPVQGGIVAALPHVDRLLAGHSPATLERFA